MKINIDRREVEVVKTEVQDVVILEMTVKEAALLRTFLGSQCFSDWEDSLENQYWSGAKKYFPKGKKDLQLQDVDVFFDTLVNVFNQDGSLKTKE